VEIERVASQDLVVDSAVNDFISNLGQAVVVVLLVMVLFLGIRTGMVVASLIPVTVVMTLLIMSLLGLGLNQVTLASLIIALGMLVDNAIVMSESIMVRMEKGAKAVDAAIKAARELIVPLLTSSATTAAAFMAFFLAESVMGEMMGNIFVVVAAALFSSWLLSMTMIPLLCSYGIRVKTHEGQKRGIFERSNIHYERLLVWSLRRPYILIGGVVILFLVSIFLLSFVPVIFMPRSDRPIVTANVELPLGTSIGRTEDVVNDIEHFIADSLLANDSREEGVESWSSYVGEGAPKYDLGYIPPESSPNAAHILINSTSDAANDRIIRLVDNYIFDHFPDVTHQVSRLLVGGGSANPVAVRISGKEPERLYEIVDQVKSKLAEIPGTKNIADDWGMRTKKIMINVNPLTAQWAGVSNQDIAISLQTVLSGAQIGEYREGDEVIPVIMRSDQASGLDIEDLESLNIYAQQTGKSVPLTQVADLGVVWQASRIKRRDLYKTITITSDLRPGYTATDVTNVLESWLKEAQPGWGLGYRYEIGGDAEASARAMAAVVAKLPLSISIIILLLISQFNSVRKPLIIILTIPLGLIGVILGLLVARSYFGFMAFLGMISLSGIVINNAIVLLDRIKMEAEQFGRAPVEAIIVAAQQRFRPILLTTATTSLGLLPLWIGGGVMWEPMAISIIFGLLFATVLTLLFVPVLYKALFRVKS
jgi:multidrug efflux pump subunit AcrB